MKTTKIPLIFFLLCSFFTSAQLSISESNGEVYRWILIENNKENSHFFETKELPTPQDDFTLAVRRLVEKNEISIYFDSVALNETGVFYNIPEHQYFLDFVNPDNNTAVTRLDYLTYQYQSDIPLMDEYDQPLIRINENGNEEFVYSDISLYPLIMSEVAYFKILQKGKKVNEIPQFEKQPLAIGFKPKSGAREMWFSWKEVASNTELNKFNCVNKILAGEFKSFHYRQFNCGPNTIEKETKKIYGELKKGDNSNLFSKTTAKTGDLKSEFIEFIVDMVNQELIEPYYGIYSMSADFPHDEQPFNFNPNNLTSPIIENEGDMKMLSQKGAILVDNTGEPMIFEVQGQKPQYVRSEDEWMYFNKNDISRFWIIQGKASSENPEFKTNTILFFKTFQGKNQPLFLIDINELGDFLDKPNVEKWYNYLREIKLTNEQIFMQSRAGDSNSGRIEFGN
jgi:hypothetical protein|tara:strand:+ start:10453 stop:11811 length:1359 start_codon:yes stop_codon:yes gene_type:complete